MEKRILINSFIENFMNSFCDEEEITDLNANIIEALWLSEDTSNLKSSQVLTFLYVISRTLDEYKRHRIINKQVEISAILKQNLIGYMPDDELILMNGDILVLLMLQEDSTDKDPILRLLNCISLTMHTYFTFQTIHIMELKENAERLSA